MPYSSAERSGRLTPLEIASGMPFGSDPASVALPRHQREVTARAALEQALRNALTTTPCVVSFSGGRDSSALLALAVHVARRDGLELPIPFTLRFPRAPDSEETAWQERVISHLGVSDWVRRELDDELDCVGPIAQRALRAHGLLWPMNAHFVAPGAEAAAGGSLVTGTGGDQVFAPSRLARHRQLLGGRIRPEPRDLLRLGYAAAPAGPRRAIVRRRLECPLDLPWLKPAARDAVVEAWFRDEASEPIRPRRYVRWTLGHRALRIGIPNLHRVAGDFGTRLVNPFLDTAFAAALAGKPARLFSGDRTVAMRALVGDLLPDDVCARASKAVFQTPFWNRHAQAFAAEWDGRGVDEDLVNPDELLAHWRRPRPFVESMTLLQSAWLAADRATSASQTVERIEQPRAGSGG